MPSQQASPIHLSPIQQELLQRLVKRGIVMKISPRTVERFLKGERFTAPS